MKHTKLCGVTYDMITLKNKSFSEFHEGTEG
jgi:hypothetical protein